MNVHSDVEIDIDEINVFYLLKMIKNSYFFYESQVN